MVSLLAVALTMVVLTAGQKHVIPVVELVTAKYVAVLGLLLILILAPEVSVPLVMEPVNAGIVTEVAYNKKQKECKKFTLFFNILCKKKKPQNHFDFKASFKQILENKKNYIITKG